LTFASGDVEGVVHVAVRGDGVVEPDEALSVGLSDPSYAKLGDASAPLTIEDGEPLALAVTAPSVTEGNRGTTPGTFTVALDGAAPAGSSMHLSTRRASIAACRCAIALACCDSESAGEQHALRAGAVHHQVR
jgi:chitinase